MSKATFFRQSGWMMFATVAGGALMWLVHFLSNRIPESEYGTQVSRLAITMLVPVGPLGAVGLSGSGAGWRLQELRRSVSSSG